MSVNHAGSMLHRLAIVAGALGALFAASRAQAAPPHYADTLPLSAVKPGMVGYGLTTFHGTTISRFEVTVIGVMHQVNEGHDLILVRMSGGPLTERHANLVEGMSGSPIYLNGKVAGAFSMGEKFPREPIGMVTPIDDMLDAWDPSIPQEPDFYRPADRSLSEPARAALRTGALMQPTGPKQTIALAHPIDIDGRHVTRLVLNARADDPMRSTDDTAVLHPATQMLAVSGLREADRAWFQKELDRRGYAVSVMASPSVGGGSSEDFKGAPLRPGSAFGTWLATGDVEVGGTGTITYRRGSRILAFGHPLFGLGALNAAISSAYILDVFPGYDVSHHIAEPGPIIGTLRQDRNFSISGEIGTMPKLIPFTVTVRDHTTGRSQTYHVHVFQHPDLTPVLLRLAARDLIGRSHSYPGDVMANVTTTLDAGEVGRVTRTNLIFNSTDVATAATADLDAITDIVSGNPFYPLPIKGAEMSIDISTGHDTATVERIFLEQGRCAPGDTLHVGVELKPYRRPSILRNIDLKIPTDTSSGRYQLIVRGGTATVTHIGPFVLTNTAPDTHTPPVNVRQMVARLYSHERSTDMTAQLVLNSAAPTLEGEKLSQLPPNLAMLMRSDRDSGVRLERDELRAVTSTPYVVSGMQQLVVTVQREDSQEPKGRGGYENSPVIQRPGNVSPLSSRGDGSDAQEDVPKGLGGDDASPPGGPTRLMRRWMSAPPVTPTAADRPLPAPGDAPPATPRPATGRAAPSGRSQTASQDSADTAAPARLTDADPPVSTTASDDRPVGRQLQFWRQTAASDFAAGKFTGVSVTAQGELRLAPRLRRLLSTGETYVWSLAADPQGDLYAGTGLGGHILKIDPQGKVSTFATLPEASVQSLLLAKDGTLWAGSGVEGNVYRIRADGEATRVCTVPARYILALAQDSRGNLYIGAGSGGDVYRLSAGEDHSRPTEATPFVKTSADHIMALAVDAHDNLYVGVGNEGAVYMVTPDGKSKVIFDARENSITALTTDQAGNVYAGTGPKGVLYRVAPDGAVSVIYDRATSFYTGLRAAPDGSLYACTVNAAYHVLPAAGADMPSVVLPLDNPSDVDFLTLALMPGGSVVVGTGNIGEVYTSQPEADQPSTGIYESPVHDAGRSSRWGAIHLEAAMDARSAIANIRAETRSGNVAEPDSTWSDWTPIAMNGANGSEGAIQSPPGRFIQYRLKLTSESGSVRAASIAHHTAASPAVSEVTLSYLPHNQAPRVGFQSPAGGERWSKTQMIRWNAEDPDNDTLTYDLFLSSDGVNWKPIRSDQATAASRSTDAPDPTLEEMKRKLAEQPNVPDSIKRLVMQSAQTRSNEIVGIGSLRQPSKSWDTSHLPDGTYYLKVIASDRVSNPVDALTATAISEPFIVCNTPPVLNIEGEPLVGTDRTVALAGSVSQALIEVTAVQYRLDGGDWVAAAPKDGLFDSQQEAFTLTTAPLTSGKHVIEIIAFNAAGGKTTKTVNVSVQ